MSKAMLILGLMTLLQVGLVYILDILCAKLDNFENKCIAAGVIFCLSAVYIVFQYFNEWDIGVSQAKTLDQDKKKYEPNDSIVRFFVYCIFRSSLYYSVTQCKPSYNLQSDLKA